MAQNPLSPDLDQTMGRPSPMAPVPTQPRLPRPPQVLPTPRASTGVPTGVPTAQPSGQAPTPIPTAPVAQQPVAPTPQPTQGPVSYTPTDPTRSLTTQTIQPGQTADRMALAQQRFDQFAASTSPAYQAALRDANRYGAAQGRLNSGSLRTDFGNLANQRSQALDLARQGFLTDQQEGSIEDAWRAIGLAERQQGFQNQQQQDAWRRALDQYGVGSDFNPYGAQRDLGAAYAGRAAQGQEALDQLLRNIPTRTPPFNPMQPSVPGGRRPFYDPTRVIPGVTDQ